MIFCTRQGIMACVLGPVYYIHRVPKKEDTFIFGIAP